MIKYYNTVYSIFGLLILTGALMMIFNIPFGNLVVFLTFVAMFSYQGSVIQKLQKQLKEKVEKEKAE